MEFLKRWQKEKGELHHAHIIFGGFNETLPVLEKFFEKELGLLVRGNSDYFKDNLSVLGIDETRYLYQLSIRKPVSGGIKIFVVGAGSITTEAQNSLLKLFEDPTPNNHFFIIMPRAARVLPTLRSRMLVIPTVDSFHRSVDLKRGKNFLSSPIVERLQSIESIVEEKNKIELGNLFDDIESVLTDGGLVKEHRSFLSNLIIMRGYLGDRSSSLKMIAEYVAHMAPMI
jgi:hypothetical protein